MEDGAVVTRTIDHRFWAQARERLPIALMVAASTALLFADGVLKNGWIEVVLLAPVVWFLAAPEVPERLKSLLLVVTIMCVTVSGLDLALRPIMHHRLNYTPLNVYAHKLPELPIVGRWDPNLRLVDRLYGDLAAVSGQAAFREYREIAFLTDQAGFRNTSVPTEADVIVLGDSFAAGWGTTQDKVFAQLLATRYGRRVYNLGYPGGPYDEFVNFCIESPRIRITPHAKVVWTLYAGNDLDDAGGETWEVENLPWRGRLGQWQVHFRTFRNRSPLNRLMETMRWRLSGKTVGVIVRELPDKRPVLFLGESEIWATRSRVEVERHPNFAKLERTLTAMRRRIEKDQLDLTILILPTKGQVYPWLLNQRMETVEAPASGFAEAVEGACGRARLRCLDTMPYLVKRARQVFAATGELLWWRDDTHLGERGHEAVAEFIAEHVLGLNVGDAEPRGQKRLEAVVGAARVWRGTTNTATTRGHETPS